MFWLLVISSLSLRSIVTPPPATHYSDFDYKVMDYMGRLDRDDTVKSTINQSMQQRYSEAFFAQANMTTRHKLILKICKLHSKYPLLWQLQSDIT